MGNTFLEITMSLDGFVAGPDISIQHPMGVGGERLHDWMFGAKTEQDGQLVAELMRNTGAVITGGHTYKIAIDEPWGGVTPFHVPAFVVSSSLTTVKDGFTIARGITDALAKAKAAAGDKDVWVMGGASIIQQFIKEGLFDKLHIHIAPVLLGSGLRLFDHIGNEHIELINTTTVDTPGAIHLRLRKS